MERLCSSAADGKLYMPYFNPQKCFEEVEMLKRQHIDEKKAKAENKKHSSLYFDNEINDFDHCD